MFNSLKMESKPNSLGDALSKVLDITSHLIIDKPWTSLQLSQLSSLNFHIEYLKDELPNESKIIQITEQLGFVNTVLLNSYTQALNELGEGRTISPIEKSIAMHAQLHTLPRLDDVIGAEIEVDSIDFSATDTSNEFFISLAKSNPKIMCDLFILIRRQRKPTFVVDDSPSLHKINESMASIEKLAGKFFFK